MVHKKLTVAVAFLMPVLLLAGCGRSYTSPEAVFTACNDAAKNKDWGTFFNCLSEESQVKMTGDFVMAGAMTTGVKDLPKLGNSDSDPAELVKKIQSIMKKHGLTEEKIESLKKGGPSKLAEIAKSVSNKKGFVTSMMAVMNKFGNNQEQLNKDQKLSNVKIEGDKAVGTVTVDGRENPAHFIKENGSWKIDMAASRRAPVR